MSEKWFAVKSRKLFFVARKRDGDNAGFQWEERELLREWKKERVLKIFSFEALKEAFMKTYIEEHVAWNLLQIAKLVCVSDENSITSTNIFKVIFQSRFSWICD